MRILQVIQREQRRGAEVFASQLSGHLQNSGQTVHLLALFGKPTNVLGRNVPLHFLGGDEKRGWLDWRLYKKLYQFIKKGQYDLVQANAGDTLRVACLSKKLFGWKAKLVFRNANKMSAFLNSFSKRSLYSWLVRELDGVASVSESCKVDFESLFPKFKKPVAYLPIGVEWQVTQAYSEFSQAGLPSVTSPLFLHAGSFVPEKNHKGLVRIYEKLLDRWPNASLLLAGDGILRSEVESIVNERKLNNVFFLGNRADLLSIMPFCTALLLPSLIEGLPGVILEAFSQKLPVVANNVGGISEVVREGETGYLCEPGDEEAFVQKTFKLVEESGDSVRNTAYDLARKKYNNTNVAASFLDYYRSLTISGNKFDL